MQCLQLTRGEPPKTPIAVTITGSGNETKCYAIINGTKQYSAGTYEVYEGDTITFGIAGGVSGSSSVTIDGTEVLKVTLQTQTYGWTVPSGISTIEISMTSRTAHSTITVTTA